MNPWTPDPCPKQARRIGKTLEELAELSKILARISIQGLDAVDPKTGVSNLQSLQEETADVQAQINLNVAFFRMDQDMLLNRIEKKEDQMTQWEKHFE